MIDDDLNENTIDMYMMRSYVNPQCIGIEEYNEDTSRIKYIKRLMNRYTNSGELKERLLLNHIIVMYNLFGPVATTRILFYTVNEQHWSALKTFMTFLQTMPDDIRGIRGKTIRSSDIPIDITVAKRLREI